MKVRVGFGLGTRASTEGPAFNAMVDALESLRFDSLWLSERLTGDCPDPLIGLAVAAGRTTKLKLGTSVQVLPGRNPVEVAKMWATLDRLSGGRTLPAFGLGLADPREHAAFGLAREERAAWFDEALPLIRRLWTEDEVDHDGPRFSFQGLKLRPKPQQSPLDVWLGGIAPSELRRVGRLADGWLASFCTPDTFAAAKPVVEAAAEAAGREIDHEHWGALVTYLPDGTEHPEDFMALLRRRQPDIDPTALVMSGHKEARRVMEGFLEAGASKFVALPLVEPADWVDELAALAETVLPLQN
jgi:probable F420-dependent oxidoreductase